jgi:hypothetical protein
MNRVGKYALFIFIFCCAGQANGVWNKVGQFNEPIASGYFFDRDNGLIGSGNNGNNGGSMSIWWTSNGGTSWNQAKTPTNGNGWISSIFMYDKLTGYASLFSNDYSVWQTTDGGKTWQDFTQGNNVRATCIYKTSKAYIKTVWDQNYNTLGGSSVNGGRSYSQVFSSGFGWSDGIDFSDDNIGAVTTGPTDPIFGGTTSSWFTQNAGVTWTQGNALKESWGIYAVKGTQQFITVPEGDMRNTNHSAYKSTDGGNNWAPIYTFQGRPDFTGHIAGVGNTIYVQTFSLTTNSGLYRSDDLGASWVSLSGPSNTRDTRFAVTGCRGEVVYAFDDQGGVWKTVDGGDGAFGFTPRVGDIPSVKAGDTTLIPIYIDSTAAPFTINQFTGSFTLNTDLLTPFGFETHGTLSGNVSFDTIYTEADKSISFVIKYSAPLKNGIPLSTPIIYIKAVAYVTKIDTTSVVLNSFNINSGASLKSLIVCSSSSTQFTLTPECGDSTLRAYVDSGTVPKFLSINPNPSASGSVGIKVFLPQRSGISVDVIDLNGRYMSHGISYGDFNQGIQNLTINTSGLSSGEYMISIHTDTGSYLTGRMVITR